MTLRQRPPQGAETIPSSRLPQQRGHPRTDDIQGLPHTQQGRRPVKWKGLEPRGLSYPAPPQTTTWEQQQEEEDRALEVARPPTSAIRYRSINQGELLQQLADSSPDEVHILVRRRSLMPQQQQALPPVQQQQQKKKRGGSPAPQQQHEPNTARWHIHWLLPLGIGMVVMLLLWLCGSWLFGQGSTLLDDLHYGRPRTFQTDAVVGHEDSEAHPSHFIALNLSRRVTILEFRGGDPSKTRVYFGPTLVRGLDLAPVTLEFRDVTGDGKPDMILHVEQATYIMINDGGGFRPPQAGDRVNL